MAELVRRVSVVPSLDDVAADPSCAHNLAPSVRAALVGQCAAVLAALAGTLIAAEELADEARQIGQEDDPIVTVPRAAEMMGYKPSYVYELIRRGELPSIQHGKYVTLRASSVQGWLREHEVLGRGGRPRELGGAAPNFAYRRQR